MWKCYSRCFQQVEGALLTELRCQLYLSRLGVWPGPRWGWLAVSPGARPRPGGWRLVLGLAALHRHAQAAGGARGGGFVRHVGGSIAGSCLDMLCCETASNGNVPCANVKYCWVEVVVESIMKLMQPYMKVDQYNMVGSVIYRVSK